MASHAVPPLPAGPAEMEDELVSFGTLRRDTKVGRPAASSPLPNGKATSAAPGRHQRKEIGLQAAPMPATRFFFPEGYSTAQTNKSNPFFHHFDVIQAEVDVPPDGPLRHLPEWAPDAYWSLSFMKANTREQLEESAPPSQELLNLAPQPSGDTVNSFDSAQWVTDMTFCKWVSRLRPRTYTDGEPCTQIMGGVIQWLMAQLVEAQQLIFNNVASQAEMEMQAAKAKLWSEYHTLRLEDEGRLRARLESDKLHHLRLAKEEAVKEKGAEIAEVEQKNAKLLGKLEETQFDNEQLKKAVSDTHKLARKYEDMMKTEMAAHQETKAKVEQLKDDLRVMQRILDKARGGALRRATQARGPDIWQLAVDACAELTAASSSYVAHLVNVGIHDGSAAKRVKLLTVAGENAQVPDPHFKYVAASVDDQFMVGRTMLEGQGVTFTLAKEGGPAEVSVDQTSDSREVYFFKGEVRSGSYFATGLQYLGRQIVAVLGADTCGGQEVGSNERLDDMDKEFIRKVAKAMETALAQDEQETELRMDPNSRMLQMVGATSAGALEDRRAELQVMRDVFADGMQFPPSDLAELRSLHLPPSHAYCVVKAAFFLLGYKEEDFHTWQQARVLLTQEFITKMRKVQPEDVSTAVREWKMALLELCHISRTQVRTESPAALVIYKWILALRAAVGALCSKRKEVKAKMAK